MPFTAPDAPRPVRAKMYVQGINYSTYGTTVTLQVVSRGEDNKAWAQATPTGTLTLNIRNESAAENFGPGQEWFVDLIPIASEQVGQAGME